MEEVGQQSSLRSNHVESIIRTLHSIRPSMILMLDADLRKVIFSTGIPSRTLLKIAFHRGWRLRILRIVPSPPHRSATMGKQASMDSIHRDLLNDMPSGLRGCHGMGISGSLTEYWTLKTRVDSKKGQNLGP